MSTRKNTACPAGTVRRKGYTRKFRKNITETGYTVRRKGKMFTVRPKADAVYVPSSCVKTRAKKGTQVFGKLRKGDLIKYGYQYRLADRLRHTALERAIGAYGALSVFHKLDAVAKLTTRSAPDAHIIFSKDREWVRQQLRSAK